jgi:hypothetical protein
MRTTEHITKTPVAAVGVFAVLRGRLRRQGTGAGGRVFIHAPLAALATAASCAVVLTLGTSAAQAAITHKFSKQITGFNRVVEIAVGPGGALLVADHNASNVVRVSAAGTALPFSCKTVECEKYIGGVEHNELTGTPAAGFQAVDGVAVNDKTGEIYVSAGKAVDIFASTGEYLNQITEVAASSGAEVTGAFQETVGLAFDQATEELYVADERSAIEKTPTETIPASDTVDVFKMTAGGSSVFTKELGTGAEKGVLTDNGGWHQSVAVSEFGALAGAVYVTDRGSGSGFVVDVFGALGGALEATWTGAGTVAGSFGIQPMSAGVDPVSGEEFVIDDQRKVVNELPPSGMAEGKALGRLTGTPSGGFGSPSAVAVDGIAGDSSEGDLYVGDQNVIDVFGPDEELPEVKTEPASALTARSATLNGKLSTGAGGPATCVFVWGTSEALGHEAACEGPGSAATPVPGGVVEEAVHANLPALSADTKYFYRLQATYTTTEATNLGEGLNATCEGRPSEDGCLSTLGAGVGNESVSEVTSTSARFQASVDPNGSPTSWYFEYGTEPCATAVHACSKAPAPPGRSVGSAKGAVTIAQPVQKGLEGGKVYHYRAVALSEVTTEVVIGHPETKLEPFYGPELTFTTQAPGEFKLIDGRAWEMVSPARKEGALIYPLGGEPQGILQAAAQGGAITYRANVPTEPGVVGYSNSMQVLSARNASTGWSSKDLPSPHATAPGSSGGHEYGEEYRFFSEDLSRGILQPAGPFQPCQNGEGKPQPCFSPEASEQTAFERDLTTGLYTPLVTGCPSPTEEVEGHTCPPAVKEHADVEAGIVFGKYGQAEAFGGEPCPPISECGPFFAGASADAKHVVLGSLVTQLTSQGGTGLYEWSADAPPSEQLRYVSELPANAGAESKADFGSEGGSPGPGRNARHAISDDGSRVFWTAESSHDLYLRDNATRPQSLLGPHGECLEPANACTIQLGAGQAEFETASSDGSRVFFSAGNGYGSLFECEIVEAPGGPSCNQSGQPTELGEGPPDIASPGSVIGSSVDGSVIYWVAANNDLYMDRYSAGKWQRTLVAVLSGEDSGNWSGTVWGLTARVSPNGEWLAFSSERSLTGYDNQDVSEAESPTRRPVQGESPPPMTKVHHDEEVFEYHAATNTLACASCDPTGARPVGEEAADAVNSSLEGGLALTVIDPAGYEFWEAYQWLAGDLLGGEAFEGSAARYQPRALTNEGRLFFDSGSALVPKDIDGAWDVYEYEPENVPAGGEHPCTPSATSGSVVFKPAHAFEAEGHSGEEGPGCVGLISSGESGQDSAFMDANESGSEVFFLTTSKLSTQDFDNAYDVYDARECTTASPCVAPPPAPGPECGTAEACRAAPNPPPGIYGAPASATFNGLGNLTPAPPAVVKKVTKKAAKCKSGYVKKKVKNKQDCVKKAKAKKKAKKSSHGKRRAGR